MSRSTVALSFSSQAVFQVLPRCSISCCTIVVSYRSSRVYKLQRTSDDYKGELERTQEKFAGTEARRYEGASPRGHGTADPSGRPVKCADSRDHAQDRNASKAEGPLR